ncbi:MAG: dockerin type I domain-containing protein [Eubacterium sp.]|nr:dockerin type I domain-containing protein [Eubacterium sp.]
MLHQNVNEKFKKLLSGFIAAVVCAACAAGSMAAFEQEEINRLSGDISTVTISGSIDRLHNDNEPAYPLSLLPDNTFDGTLYYTQLDDVSKELYDLFYEQYKSGGHGNDVDILNVLKKHNRYIYSSLSEMETDMSSNAYTAILALSADHPELSWITHVRYGVSMSYNKGAKVEAVKAVFRLTQGYNYGTAAEISNAVNTAKKEIGENGTRYELVKLIHDYICDLADYNDKAVMSESTDNYDTGWYQTAYSAFYPIASNGDTEIRTVCAGYSTAFKLLCDSYGIPCVTVQGTDNTNGNHMWNYVRMNDGRWYAVDATWDDQTENTQKIYYDYFLVGGNSISTFDNLAFNESHFNSGYWENQKRYLFAYPELADEKYDPAVNSEPEPEPDPEPGEDQMELTDEIGGTGIVVIAEKGVLDEKTVLNVEEKAADPEKPNRITYDITLTLNGEKVQPNGGITVKIPVPEAFADKKCKVYYRDMTSGEEKLVDMWAIIDDGFFVFTAEHFSEYIITTEQLVPEVILGDVNGDGKVNGQDNILLNRYLANWGNEIDMAAADMNGDGKVNGQDSIILARTLAGWYD